MFNQIGRRTTWTLWFAQGACLWLAIGGVTSARGAEPARQFLEALREQGHFDIALDYLEGMANSSLAPVDLRETILFERGVTLIASAEKQRDLAIREKLLDEAQAALQKFVVERRDNLKVTAASLQLGNLLVKRASTKLELARKNGATNTSLLAEARQQYDEAFRVFANAETEIKQRLDRIPKVLDVKDKAQARKAEERAQLREDYLFALLLAAAVREESAETVAKGSKEYVDRLTDAATRNGQIYQAFRTRIAGLYALQYQGRCNFKLGKIKDAISFYSELFDQPDEPESIRLLKLKTMPLMLACWLHDTEKKFVEAATRGEEWLANARPNEEREPELLEVRIILAKAYVQQSQELEKADPKDRQAKELRDKARKHAQFVARLPGDTQKEAQLLVAQLGGPDRSNDKPEPRTFVEARDAGKETLDTMQTAELIVKQLPARIAAEKDEAARQALQSQLDEANQTIANGRSQAIDYFQLALKLSDSETSVEDINVVRYFLCFLYYTEQQYHQSAVLGEFIARRHPDSSGARQSAKIAMASYINLYSQNQNADKSFESDSIVRIADYIAEKWPGHPEAEEALNTLIPFMINAGKIAEAEQYLQKISADSPKRAEAELKTGQAMWGAYLKGMQELKSWEEQGAPAGRDVPARTAELEGFKQRAEKLLADGFARSQSAGIVTASTALAVLSLAQVYLDTNQVEKSIVLLEDPKVGLLTLLKNNDPGIAQEGFVEDAYRTALRTYISSLDKAKDHEATIVKARDVMAAMKTAVGSTPEGNKKLVAIYLSLAKDLEQQLQLAPPDAKRALSAGFELFLNQVRDDSTEINVRNWVADTYRSMAKELMQGDKLTATSHRYFSEARKTYEVVLNSGELDAPLKTHIRLQLATTLRELGEYAEATEIFAEILSENESVLNVQIEAARTYQAGAAASPKNVKMYLLAMSGDKLDPKLNRKRIWGWGRISQMTAHKPQFLDAFHEARYSLAWCRYQYGLTLVEPSDKKKYLDLAEKDIELTAKLFKDLGGPQWRARYDALMKEIQKANGKQVIGLPKGSDTKMAG